MDRLTAALKKTSIVDWQGLLMLRFIPDHLTEAVKEVVREKQVQDLNIRKFHVFIYEPQQETPLRLVKK